MEFIAQKGEIIIMEDESCYLVLKNIEHNNEAFLRTVKTGNDILDEDYEINKDEVIYFREVVEKDECFYDFIEDEELIKVLKTL
ncbi:MAG: hypothetical protein IJ310_00180 [Clostridia bacterium]|nr:hypothetical protein [Clostridia bacterium]